MMATGRFEHLITRAADHPKKLLLNQLTLCLRNRLCRRRAARLALRDQPDTAAAMVLGRPLPDGGTAAVMFRPQQVLGWSEVPASPHAVGGAAHAVRRAACRSFYRSRYSP